MKFPQEGILKSFKVGESSKFIEGAEIDIINDFIGAYSFATKSKAFNHANLFTLYTLVSRNGLSIEDRLEDEKMWRGAPVYIESRKKVGSFEGFAYNLIKDALDDLFSYLKTSNDNIFLKAVIGHVYFKMIHPYFDFNGRTGRFIPM